MTSTNQQSKWHKHFHNFDIDNYLNRFVPRRFNILPRSFSHFLSHRPSPPNPAVWLSAFIGGFVGIAVISSVYHALPLLSGQQAPIVIASFGAAAILEYNSIESPFSQPRNLFVGHLLSTLIGVAITKGFNQLPIEKFDSLRWLAGALSVGVASAVMGITKTVHPPAGATALLASTSPEITVLGWWLLPLVLLACSLMMATALIVNNVTRTWPVYWWTPADLSQKDGQSNEQHVADVEKQAPGKAFSFSSGSTYTSDTRNADHVRQHDEPRPSITGWESQGSLSAKEYRIEIHPDKIIIPDWMETNDWESEVLEIIQRKLRDRLQS